jgi:hypothetical protein
MARTCIVSYKTIKSTTTNESTGQEAPQQQKLVETRSGHAMLDVVYVSISTLFLYKIVSVNFFNLKISF